VTVVAFQIIGDVDVASSNELAARLSDHLRTSSGDVHVDCSAMSFLDSSGMTVLVEARRQLEGQGRKLLLQGLQRPCARALVLAGLSDLLPKQRRNPFD
jgi:anti-sigma B factor antagonist